MRQSDLTKAHILKEADDLIYHKGFHNTAFSDIEKSTGLSKGNITYHFKTKKKILDEIIKMRLDEINEMLDEYAGAPTPREALVMLCDMVIGEKNQIVKYGCPMGSLTGELAKDDPDLYRLTFMMFKTFQVWINERFLILGYDGEKAEELSMELLSRLQGVAVIAHSFRDAGFLLREMDKIKGDINEKY